MWWSGSRSDCDEEVEDKAERDEFYKAKNTMTLNDEYGKLQKDILPRAIDEFFRVAVQRAYSYGNSRERYVGFTNDKEEQRE